MNNMLIVLTDKFPYGKGETFVEAERKAWCVFDRVFICPVLVKPYDEIREGFLCQDYEELITTTEQKVGIKQILQGLTGCIKSREIINEVKQTSGVENKKTAFAVAVRTNLRIKRILLELKKRIEQFDNSRILIYSYWMYEPALVAVGLKRYFTSSRVVSRAHGYDLYEDRHIYDYIPYRKMTLECLDAIYPISENGRHYLSEKYHGAYDCKISVKRLGTDKFFDGTKQEKKTDGILIVSCSNMVPLKRIDRIIDMLHLEKREMEWVHFGDGELMESIKKRTKSLPQNILVHFIGRVPNRDIQRFYSEHFVNAFVNVSEYEGVPVSIMEAQSYGIPVIATDVGGTSELVHHNENGVLLKKDFADKELLDAIEQVELNEELYRKNAKKTWEENSNAAFIFKDFFDRELALMIDKL